MRLRYLIVVLAALLAFPGAALAMIGYHATLNGGQEVPPNASPATGSATVLYDGVSKIYVHVEFSGLLGAESGCHIHGPALPGFNAGILFGIGLGNPIDAIWVNPGATNLGYLNGGELYVNVHSTLYPGGEIRGWINEDPTPVRPTTWGRIKSLYRGK